MPQQPSHILVFLTDDHGQWASSAYGHSQLHTPVMRWLGETGACMENAFTPSPVCSPARASFWTGRIPSAHGVHDYLQENPLMSPEDAHPGIGALQTLGGMLRDGGYRTGLFGKWHAGRGGAPMPGFDTWYSSLWGTQAGFREQRFSEDGKRREWFGRQTPEVTRRAIEFFRESVRRDPQQPVFMVVGYVDTHAPHNGQPPWAIAPHAAGDFPDIPREAFAPCHGRPFFPYDADDPNAHSENADYYASVEGIDGHMGEVLEAFRAEGVLDDSLVMYLSDHGHMNGHHGLHTKGNATRPQNFLEESIRIPWLARWPAGFAGGRRPTEPVDLCDAYATVLAAAGCAGAADGVPRPGRSILPLLRGEADDWREYQICEYGNARMIRSERYKLIRRGPGCAFSDFGELRRVAEDELYDLRADPRERNNCLGEADPKVVADLDRRMTDYFERYACSETDGWDAGRYAGTFNETEPWLSPE